ncbi:MAG: threonine--tRNA ligase [bacterium]|nr:threonine--tRNA ligase [bacterium]
MENKEKLMAMRHSAEHVLHLAMTDLFPGLKRAMGPATEEGFYFDFDYAGKISEEDFPKIEKRMQEIIKADLPLVRQEISIEEARKIFKDNPYKLDWTDQIEQRGEKAIVYWTGEPGKPGSDVDLCKGPHVESTGKVGPFKLLSVAGAYWHGDEKNKMLTRIYGTAFENQKELDEHLNNLEEAKQRDHRKIGKDLDLFVFSDLVGKGLPLFTPKGTTIRRELERFIVDEELKRGYQHVVTPSLAKTDLYKTSGHYPYYKETMYPAMAVDGEELILRPMTCPHHFMLYKSRPHSYKELPIKLAELSPQFRYEKSGELTGLMRVRMFCLADAHIIATVGEAKQVLSDVLDLIEYVNNVLKLKKGEDYRYRLSLGDSKDEKKYYKDDKAWDKAEETLREVLKERNEPFYEAEGEAAFYGPKIDVEMKNVAGKEETAFTVQYDFVMPKRFHLTYINNEGKEEEPIVIHRSSIGAIERIMAFLIEKYKGAFPVWLSPIQVELLPIADRHIVYSQKINDEMKNNEIRSQVNEDKETLQSKIRKATLQKVPYLGIIGDKEVENQTVSIRTREGKDLGAIKTTDFIHKIKEEIDKKL